MAALVKQRMENKYTVKNKQTKKKYIQPSWAIRLSEPEKQENTKCKSFWK